MKIAESVNFRTTRQENQAARPFWLNLWPYPYLDTDARSAGRGLIGIKIPPGQTAEIPVLLDQDSAFRQLAMKFSAFRALPGAALTGTITTVVGSTTVNGALTQFVNELAAGEPIMWLDDAGMFQTGIVNAIGGVAVLTLDEGSTSVATGVPFFRATFVSHDTIPNRSASAIANLTGTITIAAGTNVIDGSVAPLPATLFDIAGAPPWVEVGPGDVIEVVDDAGVTRRLIVATTAAADGVACATVTETMSATVGITGATFKRIGNAILSAGTVTADPVNRLLTGIGTAFTTDLTVGDLIWVNTTATGVAQCGYLDAIVSDTLAKVTWPIALAGPAGELLSVGVHDADVSPVPENLAVYNPLLRFLKLSLIQPSQQGRYQIGPPQRDNIDGVSEASVPLMSIQGYKDGLGSVRTPMLLPNEGLILIRVKNSHVDTIFFAGHIFGYKVSFDDPYKEGYGHG